MELDSIRDCLPLFKWNPYVKFSFSTIILCIMLSHGSILPMSTRPQHTYIYSYIIGHYNPLVRIIDLVSHTICVVCVNFIHKWRDWFFEKLFMAILFILGVFDRNLLRGNRRRNIFCILYWCLACCSNPSLTSNKPTHYLLNYGDFL